MKIEFPSHAEAKAHVEANPELKLQTYTLTTYEGSYAYLAVTDDEIKALDEEDEFNRRPRREDFE